MGTSITVTRAPQAERLERLDQHAQRDGLLDAAWRAACAAVDLGNRYFPGQASNIQLTLDEAQAATPAGNAAAVLRQGARTAEQRELVADLVVLAAARDFPSAPETELETARRLIWLEAHTPLRVLAPLAAHLGERSGSLAAALARAARWDPATPGGNGVDEEGSPLPRGEILVLAAALARLPAPLPLESIPPALTRDEAARRLLGAEEASEHEELLEGELGPPPRGPWKTAVLALTMWLFLSHLVRLLGRAAFGFRKPARLRIGAQGVEVESRTRLLGRTLREKRAFVPFDQLARIEREVRFARAGLYAGLAALALGTYVGAGFLVDGLRAPQGSWALVGWGLLLVALGLVADFALTSLSDGVRGRCRVVILPQKGRRLALQQVDPERADAALRRVARATGQHPA